MHQRICESVVQSHLPMRTRMQAEKEIYTGDEPLEEEAKVATRLAIPWHLRGPQEDEVQIWRGQKRRPDGRFSTPGGLDKRIKEIWIASGQINKFSFKNDRTGQPLHVCAYSVAM